MSLSGTFISCFENGRGVTEIKGRGQSRSLLPKRKICGDKNKNSWQGPWW